MPIEGRTPRDCFSKFEGHVRPLMAAVFGHSQYVGRLIHSDEVLGLSLRAVPLVTSHNDSTLFFFMTHENRAAEVGRGKSAYRLETQQYSYRIQPTAELRDRAIIRWEYNRDTPTDHHCRHHMHVKAEVGIGGDAKLNLDRLHTPTGWVLMEEVLRFLIVELGVIPACGDEWPKVLVEGERKFFEEFTSKRSLFGRVVDRARR